MLSFEDAHHGRQDYGIASFLLQIFRPQAFRRSAKADWQASKAHFQERKRRGAPLNLFGHQCPADNEDQLGWWPEQPGRVE